LTPLKSDFLSVRFPNRKLWMFIFGMVVLVLPHIGQNQVEPLPRLGISTPDAGSVSLFWDKDTEGLTLETTTDLRTPNPWEEVQQTKIESDNTFTVTVDLTEPARFYRLRREDLAPLFTPVGDLTALPGDILRVQLEAIDPYGDPITFSISGAENLPPGNLNTSGQLEFRPGPDDIGSYVFTLFALDGTYRVKQEVNLEILADPLTTTRISGVVQNTDEDPLVGVPIELGALATSTDTTGAFTLEFDGEVPGDTILIRGEQIPGADVYPFIAEKTELLLGRELFVGVNNVIDRPIYLPVLDLAQGEVIDPLADTTVDAALKDGEAPASVFVGAGTLEDQGGGMFSGILSITEVPSDLTPAALPDDLSPDVVITVQPGEMIFTAPAPLTMPNRAGWPPGTVMDLWSINPESGAFDKVGTGKVSADGTVIVTTSGGIINSSWHFFTPPPPVPSNSDSNNDTFNLNGDCPDDDIACSGFTSGVELHSGTVIEIHELVTYNSLGRTRGVRLVYDSLRADPRPIVHFGMENVGSGGFLTAMLSVGRGDFFRTAEGYEDGGLFQLIVQRQFVLNDAVRLGLG
jgi:hypothetical protein